jgi:hypothetical protein
MSKTEYCLKKNNYYDKIVTVCFLIKEPQHRNLHLK